MLLSKGLELFLADRKVSGYTHKTLSFYHDSAGDVDVSKLSECITPYFLALQDRGVSPATRHTYFRGIKTGLSPVW